MDIMQWWMHLKQISKRHKISFARKKRKKIVQPIALKLATDSMSVLDTMLHTACIRERFACALCNEWSHTVNALVKRKNSI